MIELLATLVGIAGSLYLMRKGFAAVWRRFENTNIMQIVSELQQRMKEYENRSNNIDEMLEDILVELRPNSGSTLRDAIGRIEGRQLVSSERQRAFMQIDSRAIFEADACGNCIWVNDRCLELLQTRHEDKVLGKGWLSFVSPEDREIVKSRWFAAVGDNRTFRENFHLEAHNGDFVYVKMESYALRDELGVIIGYLSYLIVPEGE